MKTIRQKSRHLVPFALALTVMATLPAAAQTYDEAFAASARGDYATALRGFRIHAEQGHAIAQLALGLKYEAGDGVAQNLVQAHKWYNLAASRLGTSDRDRHDTAVRDRDRVAARLTPTELAEAQRLAREWRR